MALKKRRGQTAATRTEIGIARITCDDCIRLCFDLGAIQYSFAKAGKDSWVETVKHSHRTQSQINVTDDGVRNADGKFAPTDIHDR